MTPDPTAAAPIPTPDDHDHNLYSAANALIDRFNLPSYRRLAVSSGQLTIGVSTDRAAAAWATALGWGTEMSGWWGAFHTTLQVLCARVPCTLPRASRLSGNCEEHHWGNQPAVSASYGDLAHSQARTMPTIVCLCGSTRFSHAFREANLRETLAGRIVLTIGVDLRSGDMLFAGLDVVQIDRIKADLDELHKRKIDLADEVLVLNVGGYIGDSTRSEIEYATQLGKPVRYLEDPPPGAVS